MTDTTQIPPATPPDQKPGAIKAAVARIDRRTINGFVVLGSLVVVVIILIFHEPPDKARDILFTLLGLFGGMAKDVIGYDFGSSAGSEKKDDAMIATAKKDAAP